MTIREITVDELSDLLPTGIRLVDVREPDEFAAERVSGGIPIPLATVPARVDDFRGDGPVYVICRSGGRSMQACVYLAEQGIDAVNVAGGTMAWIASGRPVDSGPA